MAKKTFTPFLKKEPKTAGKKSKGDPTPFNNKPKKKAGRGR